MIDWRFLIDRYLHNRRIADGFYYQFNDFTGGAYSESFFRPYILKKGDCFVDVGAHAGGWTIPASKFYNEIWAFEPFPHLVKVLRRNLEMNEIRNVIVLPTALGEKNDERDFWINEGGIGTFDKTLKPRNARFSFLKIKTLDSYGISPQVIKIDTEGYEIPILEGGMNTIRKNRPLMAIETHHREDIEKIRLMLTGYDWTLLERGDQTLMAGIPR